MDKFKLKNELRPDNRDRFRPQHGIGLTVQKVVVSKRYLMIGVGILVLLLLVISISSALKVPSRTDSNCQTVNNNGQRNIVLSGSTSGFDPGLSSSETAPREEKQTPMVPSMGRQTDNAPKTVASSRTPASTTFSAFSGSSAGSIQSAPVRYYTLQLSSASQPATLNAYARQQQLSCYWVYQTRRGGKPWYVLINGVYPSLSQAKNAVAKFSADVQAKKPWARKIGQVKKDQNT